MFKDLRRQDRKLSEEDITTVLEYGKYGVLSLMEEHGYPYGVPMHYTMIEDTIYFHCSSQGGHKIDVIKSNSKACFTVIETEDGVKSKSVIAFGELIQVDDKRQMVLEGMVEKFVPEMAWQQAKANILDALQGIFAFKLKVDYLSGKWIDKPAGR